MWLGQGHESGEAEFQRMLRAERPLLSNLMMMSQLWWCCVHTLGGGTLNGETMDATRTSVQGESNPGPYTTTQRPPGSAVPPAQPTRRWCSV